MASSPSSTPESPAPSSTGSPKSTSDTSSSSSSSSSSPSPDSSSPPPPPPGSPPPSKAPPPASSPPPPTESPPPSSPPSPSSPPPSSPPSSPPPLSSPSPSSSRPSPPPSPPPPSPRPSPPPSSPPSQSPATPDSSPPSASKGSPPPSSPSPSPPKSTAPTPSTPAFRAPPPANASPAQTGEAPQSSPSPPSNSARSPSSSSSSSGRHPSDSPPPPTRSALSPSTNTSSTAVSPSGSLPSVPTTKSTSTPTEFSGNSTVSSSSQSTSHQGMKVGVTAGVLAAIAVIGLIMAFVLLRRRRRKDRYNPYMLPSPYALSQGSGSSFMQHNAAPNLGGNISGSDFANTPSDPGGLGNSRQWFTYEELSAATNGFSSQNILGAGGFGCVYKGFLTDGKEVAVKKLKAGSGQGDREFRAEVEIISRVHHRHLVSLVGYCINEYEKLLVYEFVPNNSLHHHLHGTGRPVMGWEIQVNVDEKLNDAFSTGRPVMGWGIRVKVAAGSARGIAYLHEDCHPRIIHRDIKSANILLDNNFEAKVADFGLAKLAEELDGGNTHVSTRVMGTFGYMAPEYASSGKLTEKSDVFSFGVVLLELITGRRPVDESQPLGDESLVEWARPLLTQALETEEFEEVADPRLEGNYVRSEMFRMVEAAAACVRHSASKRPRMTQVVRALDSICEPSADLLNGVRPGQSEIFDSREQSAQIRMFQRMAFGSKDYSSEYFNNSRSSFGGGP